MARVIKAGRNYQRAHPPRCCGVRVRELSGGPDTVPAHERGFKLESVTLAALAVRFAAIESQFQVPVKK